MLQGRVCLASQPVASGCAAASAPSCASTYKSGASHRSGPASAPSAPTTLPFPIPKHSIVVTGDHSTPVEFGDHSHEPVPFAIAHVRHVVSELPCCGCHQCIAQSVPACCTVGGFMCGVQPFGRHRSTLGAPRPEEQCVGFVS